MQGWIGRIGGERLVAHVDRGVELAAGAEPARGTEGGLQGRFAVARRCSRLDRGHRRGRVEWRWRWRWFRSDGTGQPLART